MRRLNFFLGAFAICGILAFSVSRTGAQDATPTSSSGESTTLILVEHNENMADIDMGESGVAAGDLRVWGPNPLFDAENTVDTGATTQGSCVALNADFDCVADETIVFSDGSTLEVQGVQLGNAQPSMRTIVGGSGQYLGAIGTVAVAPTEDLAQWTKTIEIVLRPVN